MNERRMLVRRDTPALMLLVQALPVGFAHHVSISPKGARDKT
jgi:hypothetical protein